MTLCSTREQRAPRATLFRALERPHARHAVFWRYEDAYHVVEARVTSRPRTRGRPAMSELPDSPPVREVVDIEGLPHSCPDTRFLANRLRVASLGMYVVV